MPTSARTCARNFSAAGIHDANRPIEIAELVALLVEVGIDLRGLREVLRIVQQRDPCPGRPAGPSGTCREIRRFAHSPVSHQRLQPRRSPNMVIRCIRLPRDLPIGVVEQRRANAALLAARRAAEERWAASRRRLSRRP